MEASGLQTQPHVLPRLEQAPETSTPTITRPHLFQLDGWRGISILCVLAAHMLPIGPKNFNFNHSVALIGMVIFFNLSGYLITSFLLARPDPKDFLIRRIFRIMPLASLYLLGNLILYRSTWPTWLASFGFVTNYLPAEYTTPNAGTFWSLCVEIHFYLFVTVLVALTGRKGLWALIPVCLAITVCRIWTNEPRSNETHIRADDILAGATLALMGVGTVSNAFTWPFRKISPLFWVALLCLVEFDPDWAPQYARPYVSALMVGSTLAQPNGWFTRQLRNPVLFYLAGISYALYVIHPITYLGWMNEGPKLARYIFKRPVSFAILFLLAHLSTKYFESYFIQIGKRLSTPSPRPAPQA